MSFDPTPAEVTEFRAILARRAGLRFDDDKVETLSVLLAHRAEAAKAATAEDYFAHVEQSANELSELARALTVGETYFFRDRGQFEILEALIRSRAQSGARTLRILSAGCASGEEAYSVAICIRQTLPDLVGWTVSILGVDINPDAIEIANSARYSKWSLRETPDSIRDRYFVQHGKQFELREAVRTMSRFERHNLVESAAPFWRTGFDIVFCRNMLMYLTPAAAATVVTRIAASLAPGGHMFLGHAENLRGISTAFEPTSACGSFYYTLTERKARPKPGPSEPEGAALEDLPEPALPWFQEIARASDRIEALGRGVEKRSRTELVQPSRRRESASPDQRSGALAIALELLGQERFAEARRLVDRAGSGVVEPALLLVKAVLDVHAGDFRGAETWCEEILANDELAPGAHYVLALCREAQGDAEGAVEHGQTATYLDSGFAMAHLQLARLALRAGDSSTARRELTVAARLVEGEDPVRIVLFGGGFSRRALSEWCEAQLESIRGDR